MSKRLSKRSSKSPSVMRWATAPKRDVAYFLDTEAGGAIVISDYEWEFVPRFPLARLGSGHDFVRGLELDLAHDRERARYRRLVKSWDPERDDPIIVIDHGDAGAVVVDGNHRVGIAFRRELREISAFVGKLSS